MKKYFTYALAVTVVFLIAFTAYFWLSAEIKSRKLHEGLQKIHRLQIDDHDLQIQLTLAITDINIDELPRYTYEFIEDTDTLADFIRTQMPNDPYLQKLTAAISEANHIRNGNIEDFKRYRSLLNDAILWIRTKEASGELSEGDTWTFYRIMDGYYSTNLEESIPLPPRVSNPMTQSHINVLHTYTIKINRLTKKLAHTRTDGLIEKMIRYMEIELQEKEDSRIFMMWNFVFWGISGMLLSLFLYLQVHKSFKHAQRLSYELKQFFDALNASSIVSKTDTRGVITFANDTFCAISGYSRQELIGQPHSIVRHPDTPPLVFSALWKSIQSGTLYKVTLKNRRKNGTPYYVDSTIFPIKNEEGVITEYLAVRHDITEVIDSRDKAIEAEHFKDRFLSNMSHELRTPLNSIIGFSQLLEYKIKDQTHLKYIKSILESSHHLLNIINDLLDLSKIKSGQFSLEIRPFSLYTSFASLLERFEVQTVSKHLRFNYTLDFPLDEMVEGDWLRLSQILTNLLSNAIKFTPQGGKISLKAHYGDGILECKIADSGIGMDEATMGRIFNPFEQADLSITRKFGGTGLGLSITKELVERMEGSIHVYSRIGAGSRFGITVKLPSSRSTLSPPPERPVYRSPLHGHILAAEDNENNRILIGSLLEELGLSYTLVKDGQEALEAFGKEHFDAILMDENMPRLCGTEAMLRIRTLPGGNLPIIALTANTMAGDKERFINAGMDDFIAKPIHFEALKSLLAHYLNR
ncbi:MAG: ATP-binding protein [Sulfuricurvum sp.]|jgi:PAS domain S-box-containing protein|uniref:PAS domain-containing hybrid sensor histidine kinase/response regulator n=1 Tax=Sulfuricurvum sp. TaxID=2025608 RepID=UPI0025EB5339|nr:ATP-binding protein [Sulfuricurvum sp.]MCK9372235.1 ATP-binding protein [Sulfuricurvum sp.]